MTSCGSLHNQQYLSEKYEEAVSAVTSSGSDMKITNFAAK
jgi:hypothetical protein